MLGEGEHDSLAAPRVRSALSRLEEVQRLRFDPAVAGQPQPSDEKWFGSCRVRDVIGLVEQGAGATEISLQAAHVREMDQRDREHPEGAVLARQLDAARGEVVPGVVGEQLCRNASGEPGPADAHILPLALLAKRGECSF